MLDLKRPCEELQQAEAHHAQATEGGSFAQAMRIQGPKGSGKGFRFRAGFKV